jgi:hypothetical protein
LTPLEGALHINQKAHEKKIIIKTGEKSKKATQIDLFLVFDILILLDTHFRLGLFRFGRISTPCMCIKKKEV